MGRRSSALRRAAGLSAGVLLVLGVRAALAQDAVSAGFNVRVLSGTFGSTQTTTIVYAPAVLRVDIDRFEVAGYFPYLMIDNGTVVLSQGGFVPMQGTLAGAPQAGVPMGGATGMMGSGGMMGQGSSPSPVSQAPASSSPLTSAQAGFGDVVTSVGYRVIDDRAAGLQLVASTRIKVPTASASRGFGTGRPDLGAVASVRKRFRTGWFYAEGGYLLVGNPAGANLRNAVLWNAGIGRRLAERVYLLGSASGNSAIVQEFGAPVEVGAGLGFRLAQHFVVTALPSVGLSAASPKYAVTIGLSTTLVQR